MPNAPVEAFYNPHDEALRTLANPMPVLRRWTSGAVWFWQLFLKWCRSILGSGVKGVEDLGCLEFFKDGDVRLGAMFFQCSRPHVFCAHIAAARRVRDPSLEIKLKCPQKVFDTSAREHGPEVKTGSVPGSYDALETQPVVMGPSYDLST